MTRHFDRLKSQGIALLILKLVVVLGETSEFYRAKITSFAMCNGCGTE